MGQDLSTYHFKVIKILIPICIEHVTEPLLKLHISVTICKSLLAVKHSNLSVTKVLHSPCLQKDNQPAAPAALRRHKNLPWDSMVNHCKPWHWIIKGLQKAKQIPVSFYSWPVQTPTWLQLDNILSHYLLGCTSIWQDFSLTIASVTSITPIMPRPTSALRVIPPTLL